MGEVYVARCVRSGNWWGVEIIDDQGVHVKGGYTQARRLDQVDAMVREVISLLLDVPEDSFDVKLAPQLSADVQREVEDARARRQQAEQAQQEAINAASRAAADLVKREHLTIRDAGLILGLSHQRIDQLLDRSA
jgi:ribosomal protein L14E/L6E/L27E